MANRFDRVVKAEREFWIPVNGIDRDVITYEITRYLGKDALVRPGKNDKGQSGYLITAYRGPTSEMIYSLKEASLKYAQQRSGAGHEDPGGNRQQTQSPFLSSDNDSEDGWEDVRAPDPTRHIRHEPDRTHFRGAQNTNFSAFPLPDARNDPRERHLPSNNLDMLPFNGLASGDFRFNTYDRAMNAPSESGQTYQTMLPEGVNLRTRLASVSCEGPHSGHRIDAFLDTGATDNVISQKLYTILEAMDAGFLEGDGDASQIGSPTGEPIDVLGATKVNIRWFDHEGENQRRRIRFKIIPGLYPDMILKPTTFRELNMLPAADTWPRDDPRKGFLMFNTPWMNSKKREENKIQHEQKKAANAARAAQERQDRQNQMQGREAAVRGSTGNPQPQNATSD